jgi:hypothetical protein
MKDNKLFDLGAVYMTTTAIHAIREIVESFTDAELAAILGKERVRDLKKMSLAQRQKVARRAIYTDLVWRHVTGDWGELSEEDRQSNKRAVENYEERILSVYVIYGIRFYVITDAYRTRTTVMLATDY